MNRLLVTALALAACNGDRSRTAPGTTVIGWPPTTAPEPDDGCGDTACDDSPYFDVLYLTWSAQFGYDAEADRLVPVGTSYGPVEPSIDLLLGTRQWQRSGFDYGDTASYCLVSLPLESADEPSWVAGSSTYWYGVGYEGDRTIHTCGEEGYELDPALWGDDPSRVIAAADDGLGWGAAVGPLSANAASIVATAFRPEDIPYVFGGAIAVPLLAGTDTDVFAFSYVLDELGMVHIGADGTLDAHLAEDVRAGDGVVTGWYNVVALYIYMLSPAP